MTGEGPFHGWTLAAEQNAPAIAYLAWLIRRLGGLVEIAGDRQDDAALLALLAETGGAHDPREVVLRGPGGETFRARFSTARDAGCDDCDDDLAWAWGGLASLTGEHDGPPTAPGAPVASMCTALHVLLAFCAARYAARDTFTIAIDLADVVASLTEVSMLQFAVDGSVRSRNGDWWGRAGWGLYDCRDGQVAIALRDRPQLLAIAEGLGIGDLVRDRFDDFAWGMLAEVDELNALLVGALLDHGGDDVVRIFRAARVAVARVRPLPELPSDPHLSARGSFEIVAGARLPAPPLPAGAPVGTRAAEGVATLLAGLRVVDLSTVWAGPMAARLLADLGADVIKVTDPARAVGSYRTGQAWDRDFYAILSDRNKRVFGADLRQPGARAWLDDALEQADILIENFGPGSAARLGLDGATVAARYPRLSVVSMPALGLRGPEADAVGYGSTIEQAAGLGWLYADGEGRPHRSGVNFSDPIAGLFSAIAAILLRLTGQAGSFELSQQDCALNLLTPTFAQLAAGQALPRRREAMPSGDGWSFGCATCGRRARARTIDEVAGSPAAPGSAAVEWVTHPDGRDYPLMLLPWTGDAARTVPPSPAEMPRTLEERPW